MSACPFYSSSSETSVFYALDTFGADDLETTDAVSWTEVPMTGESVDAALTSAISERITQQRSFAGSKLVQGEVMGGINYELQASNFIYDMLICALQADKKLSIHESGTDWADDETIINGQTKHCLMFLKRVQVGNNLYDWYVFRGVQIGSISMEIQPNALLNGTINLMGVRPQDPIESQAAPAAWEFISSPNLDLMSGVDSLKNFEILISDTAAKVTMMSVTFTIENSLRQQPAVGIDSPFAAGVASGRLSATYSGQSYYSSPAVFNALLNDEAVSISGDLVDSQGAGFSFSSPYVKVTEGAIPLAGGPDQDLMIATSFQAFESVESDAEGTIRITKLAAA
jgi:hypothetical protein